MATWFTDDITWCGSDCDDKSCFRHPSNMQNRTGLHSYAYFKGTESCVKHPIKKEEVEKKKEKKESEERTMLKPAYLYKEIIEKKFAEELYSDNFFYYSGYGACNSLPEIKAEDNRYQWAIISEGTGDVVGYFAYYIDLGTDTVSNFGLYSFEHTNVTLGRDVLDKIKELVKEHRRVEWRMIGGNPVKRSYDKLCDMYGGNCVQLHAVTKDIHGIWHDEYIYEIIGTKEK